MAKKFIQAAIKHPGALTRTAKSQGKTISEYCSESHSGKSGKRCALAETLKKLRNNG